MEFAGEYNVISRFGGNPRPLDRNAPNENRSPLMMGSGITFTAIALLTVMARVYVLATMNRVASYDDVTILIAMFISLAALGVVIALAMNGGGRHIIYLTKEANILNLKLSFARQLLYLWAITMVKISIAFFLHRFSPHRYYRRFLKVCAAFILISTICATLAVLLQCQPVRYVWDKTLRGTCYSSDALTAIWYAINGFSILTDIIFSVITLPMLWSVQIKRRLKVAIIGIMALGLFAAAAAGIKIYYITKCCSIGDGVFDGTYIAMWAAAECNLGITAASIPCLRPLFGRYFGHEHRARARPGRIGSDHTHHSFMSWRSHCSHACRHETTIISHILRTEDTTSRKESHIFGQPISERRAATDGDIVSSIDGRHWERRDSPYFQQNLESLVNNVELGDVRVMYANMSRALLGPVLHNSDGAGYSTASERGAEYEDVAYESKGEGNVGRKKEWRRKTTKL